MLGFKRAPLEPGPLCDLMAALHQLHLEAGYPSARDLQRDLGGRDAPSHAAIHKVFTGSKLPTWRLVEPLVRAMARRSGRDEQAEVERIRALWGAAAQGLRIVLEPQAADATDNQADNPVAITDVNGLSRPIYKLLPDVLNEIEAVGSSTATGIFRIPTGFEDLDALLGGWSQGYLIVVGGRPSSGKTNLLLHFCRAVSIKYRLATMLITGEMNSRELQSRLLSAESRIPLHVLRTGQMSEKEWSFLTRAIKLIQDCPIHIATQSDFEMEQIAADVNRLIQEAGLKLLMVDSLQWMTEGEASLQNVESNLRRLKKLAEAAKIPIIVTAHAERPQSPPLASEPLGELMYSDPIGQFMYCDAIERVADVVILLDRPDQDYRDSPYAGEANLIVAKNRNGPTATVTVACQLHFCRFVDMAPSQFGSTATGGLHASTGEQPA